MSRIRTVKPELFKHEELFEAEQKEQLPLRLGFIALLTCCDREGRFRWQPRRLKLDMLPYDEIDLVRVLDALAYQGFIKKYEHEGKYYGHIPSWKAHQQINNKEGLSILPSPQRSTAVEVQPIIPVTESNVVISNMVNPQEANSVAPTPQHAFFIKSELATPKTTLNAIVSNFVVPQNKPPVSPTTQQPTVVETETKTDTPESNAVERNTIGSTVNKNDSRTNPPITSPLNLNGTSGTREPRVNHAFDTRGSQVNNALNTEDLRVNHACSEDLRGKEGKGKGKEEEGNGSIVASGTRHGASIESIAQVFEHWKVVMDYPDAKLDEARKYIIKKALSSGYSTEQLCHAITGCSFTPHNMGDNERGQRFNGLQVILRDGDQIDRFISHYQQPPRARTEPERRTESNIHTLQRWIDSKMQEVASHANA